MKNRLLDTAGTHVSHHVTEDLGIRRAVNNITNNTDMQDQALRVITSLRSDRAEIVSRQQILRDCVENPDLMNQLNIHMAEYMRLKSEWLAMRSQLLSAGDRSHYVLDRQINMFNHCVETLFALADQYESLHADLSRASAGAGGDYTRP